MTPPHTAPDPFGVVAIGGSAGAIEAVTALAAGLPADAPYAVLVALHLPRHAPSGLARIIDRAGPLPAVAAQSGRHLEPGRINVAIPDHHLLAEDHRTLLSAGPTENGHRPALNALFRSVAVAFGPRAVGVLLSGVLDDGVLGLAAIRSRGGRTVVQSPADALFATLPSNAIAAGVADQQAPAAEIGAVLAYLAERPSAPIDPQPDPTMDLENLIAMSARLPPDLDTETLGPPSGYTCPDCNGSLQEVGAGYRCHIGHAWSAEALLAARDPEIDAALPVALRSLQDKARLARRMADRAGGELRRRHLATADEAERALASLGAALSRDPESPRAPDR